LKATPQNTVRPLYIGLNMIGDLIGMVADVVVFGLFNKWFFITIPRTENIYVSYPKMTIR